MDIDNLLKDYDATKKDSTVAETVESIVDETETNWINILLKDIE